MKHTFRLLVMVTQAFMPNYDSKEVNYEISDFDTSPSRYRQPS